MMRNLSCFRRVVKGWKEVHLGQALYLIDTSHGIGHSLLFAHIAIDEADGFWRTLTTAVQESSSQTTKFNALKVWR